MTTHYATLAGRILLLMACFQHWAVAAPPCDDHLAPVSDPRTGYHLREPNTRCEGFYKAPVSAAADLELVSLTRGRLRFDSATIGPLELSSPVRHEAVQLRGIALPDKTYYRLDGLIPAAGGLSLEFVRCGAAPASPPGRFRLVWPTRGPAGGCCADHRRPGTGAQPAGARSESLR